MSKTRFLALLLILISFILVMFCSCSEGQKRKSSQWQPPSYERMPLAFDTQAADSSKSDGSTNDQTIFNVPSYARAWHAPAGFGNFIYNWGKGFISLYETADLPQDLPWQDGMEEPEIGSPKALKGGMIRLAMLRSFPNTLRALGEGSNNSTRRFLYDDIKLDLVYQHAATGNIIPGTASRWAVTEGGQCVYFEIDPKATFSNGDPLRSQDFLTAIFLTNSEFSLDPEFSNYYQKHFERICIYSDRVFSIKLKSPSPLAALFAVIPAHNTRFYAEFGPDFSTRYQWRIPPTTGGYTPDAESLHMGSQLRMKRVKDWWAKERLYTRYSCNVDTIHYTFMTEITKARELFRMGEIDALSLRESVDWYENLEIPQLHNGYIQRVKFYNIWPRNSFGLHLNTSKPPFDDKNMRLGLHHALNVQAVIEQVFRGDFTRSGTYFAGFGNYSNEQLQALPYDPQTARSYFAKAGYTQEGADGILQKKDGTRLQITITTRIDPLYNNVMSWLKRDAARCGVELLSESMDDTLFFSHVMQKKPTCSLFSWGFMPPLPTPQPYFHSSLTGPNTNNITATSNAELDALIDALPLCSTEQSLISTHHRIQELIADEATWVPFWTSTFWRFAQWRWLRWPQTDSCTFCPPRSYDPLDSHLYWIDPKVQQAILHAKQEGRSLGEKELIIPLPQP